MSVFYSFYLPHWVTVCYKLKCGENRAKEVRSISLLFCKCIESALQIMGIRKDPDYGASITPCAAAG